MVFCEGDMPPDTELIKPELFGQDEPPAMQKSQTCKTLRTRANI